MELSVALKNYDILKDLPEHTRIRVNPVDGCMSYEERYFMSARRYMDQSSRTQLIEPLKQTFTLIRTVIDEEELLDTFTRLSNTLEKIYRRKDPSSDDIFALIDSIIHELSPKTPVVSPPSMSPTTTPKTSNETSPPAPPAPPFPSQLTDKREMKKFQDEFQRYYETQRKAPPPVTMTPDDDFEKPPVSHLSDIAIVRRRRPDDVRIRISPDESLDEVEPQTNRCVLISNILNWFRDTFSSN